MLERSHSLLQYYNNTASLQDWYSTNRGSHTPLQDEGDEAYDGSGGRTAALVHMVTRGKQEHRNRQLSTLTVNIETFKLGETSEWWTSLSTSHDERILTAVSDRLLCLLSIPLMEPHMLKETTAQPWTPTLEMRAATEAKQFSPWSHTRK